MTHDQERYPEPTLGSRPFSRGGLLDPTTSPLSQPMRLSETKDRGDQWISDSQRECPANLTLS